uniref:tigger transposable element-derived protein 1-like n=1 Tax=Myxine glutinosa TaxID=7769 RepID=UPI003590093E
MTGKRSASSKGSGTEPKRQRKMLNIVEKVKLLDMLKEGRSFAAVGRHYGLNESTVRYIKKDEKNIRATAAVSFNQTAKRVVTSRNKAIARQLYAKFAEGAGDDDPESEPSTASPTKPTKFNASKGWFEKFQKRFKRKSVVLHGEAASADKAAAEGYVNETFRTIIEEGGYKPEQVFNMDETALFWKRMPSRTFIMIEGARAPGFNAHKDRVTLVMCGNAAGFMIKPGLIYKSKNPRVLKNKNKNLLPVYWMHNQKSWITKLLTSDWFHQCFIPEVKLYLAEKGLEFKVLLLMDNAGHALDLSYDGVQIEFLPPNTTSLIQPMDQGVIRAFKALYMRNTLQHLVEAMDSDENFSLKAYWREYTIATCLQNIQMAIKEMKTETLNACWKKLWPEVVHDYVYKGFSPDEVHHSAVDKAMKLAKLLGGDRFNDMTPDDVEELLKTHSDPLTDEDLAEMTKGIKESNSTRVRCQQLFDPCMSFFLIWNQEWFISVDILLQLLNVIGGCLKHLSTESCRFSSYRSRQSTLLKILASHGLYSIFNEYQCLVVHGRGTDNDSKEAPHLAWRMRDCSLFQGTVPVCIIFQETYSQTSFTTKDCLISTFVDILQDILERLGLVAYFNIDV